MRKRFISQDDFTPRDVTSLGDAAAAAWREASSRRRSVTFEWRNQWFKSHLTCFRMKVDSMDGRPLVCRYY